MEFLLLSDYHTFDHYIGVGAEDYQVYHAGLEKMIRDVGGEDIIKLLSLASYEEFSRVDPSLLSRCLNDRFGDKNFRQEFDIQSNTTSEATFKEGLEDKRCYKEEDVVFKDIVKRFWEAVE